MASLNDKVVVGQSSLLTTSSTTVNLNANEYDTIVATGLGVGVTLPLLANVTVGYSLTALCTGGAATLTRNASEPALPGSLTGWVFPQSGAATTNVASSAAGGTVMVVVSTEAVTVSGVTTIYKVWRTVLRT